jgi:hypothetical protein
MEYRAASLRNEGRRFEMTEVKTKANRQAARDAKNIPRVHAGISAERHGMVMEAGK